MDLDNLSFDSDLDELLAEVKGYTEPEAEAESTVVKDWSLDDIDALIAGLDSPAPKAASVPAAEEKQEEYTAKQPTVFPDEDKPVESYFRMDAKPEPVKINIPETEPEEIVVEAKPTLSYDDAMSETDVDSIISSLFGDFSFGEPEVPKAEEEPAPEAVPGTEEAEAEMPEVQEPEAPAADAPQSEPQSAEDIIAAIIGKSDDDEKAEEPASEAPEEKSEEPIPEAEKEEETEEPRMGEIREFSVSKANAKKLSGFVINEPVPEQKKEEEEEPFDPEKIPVYDPLAEYEARKKQSEQPGMVTDRNRESFLNHMELEDTAEIDTEFLEPIDRPGMIIKKSQFEMTSDLDPLPTVMSADKAKADARTRIAGAAAKQEPAEPPEEEFPGQIKLSGFEPVPEEQLPEDTSEEELEAMLTESRRHKAKDFRILQNDEDEEDDGAIPIEKIADDSDEFDIAAAALEEGAGNESVKKPKKSKKSKGRKLFSMSAKIPEFNELADRKHVHAALNATAIISLRQLVVDAVILLIMLIFNIVPFFVGDSDMFSEGGTGIYVANALLLIVAVVFNSRIIFSGFTSLFGGRPDASSAAALTAIVAFVHNTVTAAVELRQGGTSPVYAMVGVIAFAAVSAADYFNAQRMVRNFEMCAYRYEKNLYTIHEFEDENEVRELSRGVLLDSASLLYSSKTDFPSDFIKNSSNYSAESSAVSKILPISAIAAVVTAAIAGFISREFMSAFNALCCTFCITAPVFSALVPAVSSKSAGKALSEDGAFITGIDSASRYTNANAVVIDSCDIFNRSKCRMHGMVDFKQIRMDDLLVYAAALVIKSGGPLRECFESVISEDHNLLPSVRDLAYEDKLGVSARIHSQKVLLGNRSLLENHGVNVPDISLEEKYTQTGKRVLYLAVCGKLAAMFVVSYAVDLNLRPYLEYLEDSGVTIMVRTNDVNVTEDLLSRGFGLPKSAFCVLGSVAGRLFTQRRDEVTPSASIHMGHNGNAFSMLRAVTSAYHLCKNAEFGTLLQIALSVIAFVLSAILAATSTGLGAITSALAACVIAAASYFIPDFINRKD